QPPQPEDPLVVPQVPQGAPMEVVMAALVNTINRQGQILREQANNMRGQNELIREQNRRLRAVEESRAVSRASRSARRQRSPTPENNRSRSRRSPPRRNNRSPPRSGEAAVRGGNPRHSPRRESPSSGDERHRGPLSRRIMDIPLPRGLEKPPTLDKYDGTTDPDEHVQSVETALDYRNLRGSIKCKLFPLSLVRGASTWWRNLPPGSIDSWEELCRMFTAHFTTSRRHPKTMASLKAIVQGPEESLRNYIERFNKVSVEVEATDKMKLYLLEEGLREGTKFQEAVGILEVETLDAFFELAQQYIKYEDKQKASEVRRPKNFEVGGPSSQREERRGDEKKREGGKIREAKPPKSQFTYHTPLNAHRDRILSEISNAEFKSAGIRFPKQLPAKPNVDKKKFCRFHKSYGHVTDDCVHLKDAIEIPIQKGYARQYVDGQPRAANNNAPRQNQLAVDPASPEQHVEDENRVIGGVALAISRPEDFLPLQTDEEKGALDYLAANLDGSWENFPGALVISGGGFNPITIGSIKRKFDELEKASPVEEVKITEVKESFVPLAFYREEVPGGSPNFQIPLLVRAKMANFDVRRILVDQGSSCDIIFYLTERGIEANPDKCRAFFDYPSPKSKKSIQTLNGMLTSMARFVAKSAQHALPLFKLLRKETTFEWTEECEGALQHLKRALFEPPVLTRPVEGEKLYLYLAVASEAISAVLVRETEQGQKPVYFVSRALQGPELRYLQIEKIALTVIMAARKLRYYFLAHSIIIRTDQPVKQLLARPDMVGRMLKWSLELAEFDISFESRKALKAQVLADFVAEMTTSTTSEKNKWTIFVDGSSNSQGSGASIILENRDGFILQEIHEGINGQHIGGRSLARKALRERYYWPTMQNDTKDHVLKCDKCQRHGDMHPAPANELKTLISPWPFAWWGMDILGPFPTAVRQAKYLIVAVDYFTKWIEAEHLAKISASNILRFFKRDVLARFGIPQVVVTDNGTQFTNKKFQEFLATIGTTQHFTSVEHPQTNGQAEAANRVLLRGLRRRMGASKGNWTEELHNVLWSYRTTPHSTTGETPFRLTYGTEAVIPVEIGEPSSRTEYPPEEDINDELLR
ncbi:hypothetical protein TSUD_410870, partial [Trifolium subterraneum]